MLQYICITITLHIKLHNIAHLQFLKVTVVMEHNNEHKLFEVIIYV